jgi:hypothetical protein
VFRPVTAIGDGFVAQRRNCLAAGAALTPDRLSGMREIIWRQVRLLPAAYGAGIVAAPAVLVTAERRVVAANTPHWISGTRLARLPGAGDGDFAAIREIGAHSGWLLAAASDPA